MCNLEVTGRGTYLAGARSVMELVSSQKFLPDLAKRLEPHAIVEEGKKAFISEDLPLLMGRNRLKHCGFQWRCSFTTDCRGTSQAKTENRVTISPFLPLFRDERLRSHLRLNDLHRVLNGKEQAFHFKLS